MLTLSPPLPPSQPPLKLPPNKQSRGPTPLDLPEKSFETRKIGPELTLRHPRRSERSLSVWCSVIICFVFSIFLICFGVATLVVYLAIRPRYPTFDIAAASLNNIYLDPSEYFNGDIILLANFSNPNRKIEMVFEYLDIRLYFSNRFIGTQGIQPFSLKQGQRRMETLHLVSSLVYMPRDLGVLLQKQVESNKVSYYVLGTFKVRASLGLIRFSLWLHGRCQLYMTGPPTGILVGRSCKMKR
ncbi:hypothetical protein MLD38_000885 [Melastoma candidum]|uniref:Uncharacterized protein n=1 Tax=Melastoma candidum TaxID=119954 RepID=A0ACB9SD28_9MYRT|nr:hypothetical protein MLD38_000885 [Melastoma candidum]